MKSEPIYGYCPFCGKDGLCITPRLMPKAPNRVQIQYAIRCVHCWASGPIEDDEEAALSAWHVGFPATGVMM